MFPSLPKKIDSSNRRGENESFCVVQFLNGVGADEYSVFPTAVSIDICTCCLCYAACIAPRIVSLRVRKGNRSRRDAASWRGSCIPHGRNAPTTYLVYNIHTYIRSRRLVSFCLEIDTARNVGDLNKRMYSCTYQCIVEYQGLQDY